MTYETSNKDATEFVKGGIWIHTCSQEPELQFGALCMKKDKHYFLYILHLRSISFTWTQSKYLPHLLCNLIQNVSGILYFHYTDVIIVVLVSLFDELFLSEGFHIFRYMYVDIITQIHACMNILNEAWMLMFFGSKIWHMRPPTKTQQSLSRLGFESTFSQKN